MDYARSMHGIFVELMELEWSMHRILEEYACNTDGMLMESGSNMDEVSME